MITLSWGYTISAAFSWSKFRTLNDLLLKIRFKNNNDSLCKRCKENRRALPPDCESDGHTVQNRRALPPDCESDGHIQFLQFLVSYPYPLIRRVSLRETLRISRIAIPSRRFQDLEFPFWVFGKRETPNFKICDSDSQSD